MEPSAHDDHEAYLRAPAGWMLLAGVVMFVLVTAFIIRAVLDDS